MTRKVAVSSRMTGASTGSTQFEGDAVTIIHPQHITKYSALKPILRGVPLYTQATGISAEPLAELKLRKIA